MAFKKANILLHIAIGNLFVFPEVVEGVANFSFDLREEILQQREGDCLNTVLKLENGFVVELRGMKVQIVENLLDESAGVLEVIVLLDVVMRLVISLLQTLRAN
jgi:hypothetical protein